MSDSVSPRQTAEMQSATRAPWACRSIGLSPGPSTPKSCTQVSPSPPAQARRDLLDHAQPEVLEHRHRRRQLDLAAALVEPDARALAALVGLVLEPDHERLAERLEPREAADVVDGERGGGRGLVVAREARAPLGRQHAALQLAVARDQRVPQLVVPRAGRRHDLALELAEVDGRPGRRRRGRGSGSARGRPRRARGGSRPRRSRSGRAAGPAGAPAARRRSASAAARRSATRCGCRGRGGRAAAPARPAARAAPRPRRAGRRSRRRTARPWGTSRTARPTAL